jgi:thiamine transport system substrate-binding protein
VLALTSDASAVGSQKETLTVYMHSTLTKDWSDENHPVRRGFERQCKCKLELVDFDSDGTLLTRLYFEGRKSKADIAFGLDQTFIEKAKKSGLFAPHGVDLSDLDMPISWQEEYFIPFNYGYFSFIYDKNKIQNPPTSLEELVFKRNDLKIIIQDPRSASSGFGLITWMKEIFGDRAFEAWKSMFKNIVTVTKGWGESYSLFLKGEADLVLSYSTSPAYHMMMEKKYNYRGTLFKEGHLTQVEVVGKLANAPHPQLAQMFLEFVLSKTFQYYIPRNTFMYPVINLGKDMPIEYMDIPKPKKYIPVDSKKFQKYKNIWIQEWLNAAAKK